MIMKIVAAIIGDVDIAEDPPSPSGRGQGEGLKI